MLFKTIESSLYKYLHVVNIKFVLAELNVRILVMCMRVLTFDWLSSVWDFLLERIL